MKPAASVAAWIVVGVLSALTSWRIVATALSDRLASAQPAQALAWDSANPAALIALAREQLDQHAFGAARETVLRLLAHEPLTGRGFDLLAKIAVAEGNHPDATLLSTIARRRAPHARAPLAWLVADQLSQGRYADALDNVDRLLRIAPGQRQSMFPLLIDLADRPDFADALALRLVARPIWRDQFVSNLMSKGSAGTVDRVLSGIQRRAGLDTREIGRWIDFLAARGQWGEAYARWAGELDAVAQTGLTSVYNGGFEIPPSGLGFDWRIDTAAGVLVDRGASAGAGGSQALRLIFPGQRVESIPVHQWLLLAPGAYRLRFRTSADDLRSDRGVQWVIRCQQRGPELATSKTLDGTFDWIELTVDFIVPDKACIAQDLSLRNAGSKGAGKIILGTLWFDDLSIDRIARQP